MQDRCSIWKRLAPDLAGLALLAVVALGIGVAINHFRSKPLPLVYHTKAQRLDQAVAAISKEALPAPSTNSSSPTTPVTAAPATISHVTLEEMKERSNAKEGVILDARAEFFYQMGHVPGAWSLPRSDFETAYAKLKPRLESDKNKQVTVYCSGSDCEDSQMVAEALVKLGFQHVAVFKGGWEEWTGAHLPEEKTQ